MKCRIKWRHARVRNWRDFDPPEIAPDLHEAQQRVMILETIEKRLIEFRIFEEPY